MNHTKAESLWEIQTLIHVYTTVISENYLEYGIEFSDAIIGFPLWTDNWDGNTLAVNPGNYGEKVTNVIKINVKAENPH